jgi:hypothetical protein
VSLAREEVDFLVVRRRQTARADYDVDAPLERRENIFSDNGRMREIDKDIHTDGIKRVRDR